MNSFSVSSDVPSIVFFIISFKILFKNGFNLFSNLNSMSFELSKSIRNYEKRQCLEHQMLGWWVVRLIDPASQRIILKIVGFQIRMTQGPNIIEHFLVISDQCASRPRLIQCSMGTLCPSLDIEKVPWWCRQKVVFRKSL